MSQKKRKGGKPEHKPTKTKRDLVRAGAVLKMKQTDIAAALGIAYTTLRKHYAEELKTGKLNFDMKAMSAMGKRILSSDPRDNNIKIFYAKTMLGMTEANFGKDDDEPKKKEKFIVEIKPSRELTDEHKKLLGLSIPDSQQPTTD